MPLRKPKSCHLVRLPHDVARAMLFAFLDEEDMAFLNQTCTWAVDVMRLPPNQEEALQTDYHVIQRGRARMDELVRRERSVCPNYISSPVPNFPEMLQHHFAGRGMWFLLGRRGVGFAWGYITPALLAGAFERIILNGQKGWTLQQHRRRRSKAKLKWNVTPHKLQTTLREVAMAEGDLTLDMRDQIKQFVWF